MAGVNLVLAFPGWERWGWGRDGGVPGNGRGVVTPRRPAGRCHPPALRPGEVTEPVWTLGSLSVAA